MTDEEFEKELDKMYDELDQQQAEMEELGLINYGDSGYYLRNPEEYEKDKMICELESKIERLEYLLEISDKAKIDFAVERLEKVIDILDKNYWDTPYEDWSKAMANVQTKIAELMKETKEGK
jgi:hypothetical protein